MSAITILGFLLLLIMVIFGGKKDSFLFHFVLNFIILVISILLIIYGVSIYLVTFIFCFIIAAINLFVLNSYNVKTQAAFLGTLVTILILILMIYFSVEMGHLQGFATEQQDETYVYSMNIGINMVQFMVFTIVLAVIAAVIDLAITISSPCMN